MGEDVGEDARACGVSCVGNLVEVANKDVGAVLEAEAVQAAALVGGKCGALAEFVLEVGVDDGEVRGGVASDGSPFDCRLGGVGRGGGARCGGVGGGSR